MDRASRVIRGSGFGKTQRAISSFEFVSMRKPPYSGTGIGNPRAIDRADSHALKSNGSTRCLVIISGDLHGSYVTMEAGKRIGKKPPIPAIRALTPPSNP